MLIVAFVGSQLLVAGVLVAWYFDQRRHEALVRDILDRVSTSPRVEFRSTIPSMPAPSQDPPYVSDLPYHDEVWDEFAKSNEALGETEQ